MIQFDYESIDFNSTKTSYKLSSVFGEDNFFYGVTDLSTNKLIKAKFITDLPLDYWLKESIIDELMVSENLHQLKPKRTVNAILNDAFNLLPNELDLKKKSAVRSNLNPLYDDPAYIQKMQRIDLVGAELHYSIPLSLYDGLEKYFLGSTYCHFNGAMISSMNLLDEQSFVMIHIQGRTIQTFCYINNVLQQTNHYELQGKDDTLYYTLLTLKTNDLDPLKTQVFFTGPFDLDNKIIQEMKPHLNDMVPYGINDRLLYANVFLGTSKHQFFGLQAVSKCVL
jgi:hypothetical protein